MQFEKQPKLIKNKLKRLLSFQWMTWKEERTFLTCKRGKALVLHAEEEVDDDERNLEMGFNQA